jgi:DNA ligase (NAD+)
VQKELEAAGEEVRANPRNHAAGGIRQFKDPKKTKKMRLSFIAYGIENLETPDGKTPYKTEIERAIWCNTVLKIPFVRTEPFNFYSLADLEAHVPYLDYEVDGAVISVNDLEEQEQLGRHGDRPNGNPRGKVAWKFAEERQKPVIKEIVWQPGRTGVIKPVACFDAVPLAGTQVERATLHNLGFMIRGKIDVGTQIEVLKAGKIIPKVVGVVGGQCQGVPNHPKVCPSCGKPTTVKHTPAKGSQEEMWELICENKLCPAQNISGLCHFLTTLGILGLGDRRVQQLTSVGVVKEPADFFKITVKDCEKAGMSTRQALIAIGNIHMISKPDKIKDNDDLEKKITKAVSTKKKVQLWQLIAALGIPTAGKSAGKALVNHFHDFDRIRKASKEELQTVDEIGEKTSVILSLFFEENADVVDHLLQYIEPEQPKTGKLSGKKFVFSGGGFPNGKAFWEKQAEEKGATCSSSVSKTTDYLVAGEGSGTKSDAAKKYGIPIIDLDEFKKML